MNTPLSREEIEILLVHPERGLNVVPALCRQLLDAEDENARLIARQWPIWKFDCPHGTYQIARNGICPSCGATGAKVDPLNVADECRSLKVKLEEARVAIGLLEAELKPPPNPNPNR